MKAIEKAIVASAATMVGETVLVEGHIHLFDFDRFLFICDSQETVDPALEGIPIVDPAFDAAFYEVVPPLAGGPAVAGRARIVGNIVRDSRSLTGYALDHVQAAQVTQSIYNFDLTPEIERQRTLTRK